MRLYRLGLGMCFGLASVLALASPATSDNPWVDKPIGDFHELVLAEGTQLTAQTAIGDLLITAGAGTLRTYSWDKGVCERSADLWPRQKRWYGQYGLYYPGPGSHWKICNGIHRAILEEGQLHFATEEGISQWLEEQRKYCFPSGLHKCDLVYTSDGLVVKYTNSPIALQAKVTQLYLNGVKPVSLQGATDNITLGPASPRKHDEPESLSPETVPPSP